MSEGQEYIAAMAVESEPPSDVQHPLMYERAVYIQGGIAALCAAGVIALAILNKTVDAGLVALGGVAVGSLAQLLAPRQK